MLDAHESPLEGYRDSPWSGEKVGGLEVLDTLEYPLEGGRDGPGLGGMRAG